MKHSKSGFKSLTFEDKAQDAELSDHIAHAVSQVEYEVKRMRKSLLYANFTLDYCRMDEIGLQYCGRLYAVKYC